MQSEILEQTPLVASDPIQKGCDFCGRHSPDKVFFRSVVSYPACASFEIYYCRHCRVAYTLPRNAPSQEELYNGFRGHHGKRFFEGVEWFIHFAEKNRADRIARFREKGKVLDVGCGRGLLLYYLKKAGWETLWTESGEETCRQIQERFGVPMRSGDFRQLGLLSESFDCVVLWHVFEHLQDPVAVLQEARRLLRVKGVLILAVPNFESFQARCFRGRWFHLNPLYHTNHFSLSSLVSIAEANGFCVKKVHHFFFCHNVYGWLQSFLNLFFKEQNFLFYALQRVASGKNTKKFGVKLFAAFGLSVLFFIPSLLLALLEGALRRGGTVELWLEKRHV